VRSEPPGDRPQTVGLELLGT